MKYKKRNCPPNTLGRTLIGSPGRVLAGSAGQPATKHNGYSETSDDGQPFAPWMTRRECQADARARGASAKFVTPSKITT